MVVVSGKDKKMKQRTSQAKAATVSNSVQAVFWATSVLLLAGALFSIGL